MEIGITKAAQISEMTPQNLRYLIAKGIGPVCKLFMGRRIFDDRQVRSWYKQYKKKKLSRSNAR
jgi:hypothetical protein